MRKAAAAELFKFGQEVKTASQLIVPVKTGALMNTAQVTLPEVTGQMITVTVGYGDESVGYALIVHENMAAVNWTRPGSGPKYLETPLKERQDKLPERVANAITAALRNP